MIHEKSLGSEILPQEIRPVLPLSEKDLRMLAYSYPIFLMKAQASPKIDWSDKVYTLSADSVVESPEHLQTQPEKLLQDLDRLFTDKLPEYQEQRTHGGTQSIESWTFGTDGYVWHVIYTPMQSMEVMRRKDVVDVEGEIYAQEQHFSISLSEASILHIDRAVVKDDDNNFHMDGERRMHEAAIFAIEREVESLKSEPDVDSQTDSFTAAFVAMAEIIIDLMPYDDYEDWRQKRDGIVPLLLRCYRFFEEKPFHSAKPSVLKLDAQFDVYIHQLQEALQNYFQGMNTDDLMMHDDFGVEGEHDHTSELSDSAHHTLKLLCKLGTFDFQEPKLMFDMLTKYETQSVPAEIPLSYLVAQLSELHALDLLGDSIGIHITLSDVLLDLSHLEVTYLTEILYSFGIFNRLFFKEDLERMLHAHDALNESWTKPEFIEHDTYVWWTGHQPRIQRHMKEGKTFGAQVRYLPILTEDWDQDVPFIFRHVHIGSMAIRAYQKNAGDRSQNEKLLAEDWEWYMTQWKNLLASVNIQELPDDKRYITLTEQELTRLMADENRKATPYDRFVTKIFLTSYTNTAFRDQGIDITLTFQERVLEHASGV